MKSWRSFHVNKRLQNRRIQLNFLWKSDTKFMYNVYFERYYIDFFALYLEIQSKLEQTRNDFCRKQFLENNDPPFFRRCSGDIDDLILHVTNRI